MRPGVMGSWSSSDKLWEEVMARESPWVGGVEAEKS